MKKNILSILAVVSVTIIVIFYYVPSSKTPKELPLKVGTCADYPPYSSIDLNTGKIVGLDVDIITEIATRLGKKVKIFDMPFNSLLMELAAGQIDVIAAGVTVNDERAKTILFSTPYVDNDSLVIVTDKKNPALTDITNIYWKTVGVATGYSSDLYLSTIPAITLTRLENISDLILALQNNSIDAFSTSKTVYDYFTNILGEGHTYQAFTVPSVIDTYALGISKKNKDLQKNINNALDSMKKDGTLEKIKKTWGIGNDQP